MYSKSDIPSNYHAILASTIGCRIVSMIRYSWYDGAIAVKECEVASQDVFSLTAGPLSIEYDSGLILAFAYEPSLNSILVWVERDINGMLKRETLLKDKTKLFPITATDAIFSSQFWFEMIGKKVLAIEILNTHEHSSLPNEAGVLITLENQSCFVLSHNLADTPDNFALIPVNSISYPYSEIEKIFVTK